jgi:hypothetical protein
MKTNDEPVQFEDSVGPNGIRPEGLNAALAHPPGQTNETVDGKNDPLVWVPGLVEQFSSIIDHAIGDWKWMPPEDIKADVALDLFKRARTKGWKFVNDLKDPEKLISKLAQRRVMKKLRRTM